MASLADLLAEHIANEGFTVYLDTENENAGRQAIETFALSDHQITPQVRKVAHASYEEQL
jgi:hypothetical protein